MNTVKIGISLPKQLYDVIEKRRGLIPRSRFVSEILKDALKPEEAADGRLP